jgi:hypothetical protein
MKKNLYCILIILLVLFCYQIDLKASVITLKSGVIITGKMIDMNDESITIQDSSTKQLRSIKSVFIRDIILDPIEKKIEVKEKKGKDIKLRGERVDTLLYELQPELGILPGIAYPFGKLGNALKIGYGAYIFSDVRVPMKQENFQIRLGLSVGFLYHGTNRPDVSSNVMMLPIIAYGKFLYNFGTGLRPYIKVGGGITPVMAGATDMDPTVAVSIGLGYINNKLPYLEFFIEAGMMMVFESVRGDFITANIGVTYRFGAPTAEISSTKK